MTRDADKAAAAFATLEFLGYTWAGGEQWKPPLGKTAHPQQPAPLTDVAILRIVQRTIHGTTLRLTLDVGPYEVAEPTRDLCMLIRAIEAAHSIVPAPTIGENS